MPPFLRWIFIPVLLTACGATLKPPPLPDGKLRHPINTSSRISEYREQQVSEVEKTRSPQDERIAALEAHIAALHVLLAPPPESTQHSSDGNTGSQAVVQNPPVVDGLAPLEAIQLRPRSIAFSVPFGVGDAGFEPSAPLRDLLLRAAADSPRIEVRGRTDAEGYTPSDGVLALRRSAAARAFLASHGIELARIHATALASGGHAADNSTAAGKARNRRVDIEVMDIDPMVHKMEVQPVGGEQHEPD
jgi:outer membrane protein OmpA-like peptidoglycan-associated protein